MQCFPTTFIALKHLRFGHEHPSGPVNIRRPTRDDALKLVPSIRQEGLLQALFVCPDPDHGTEEFKDGPFYAIAGGRRLLALQIIRDEHHELDDDSPISVVIGEHLNGALSESAAALAKSIAAEDAHVPPHPVDRYEAFNVLAGKGMDDSAIAARLFIEPRIVRQALALGALAPEIRTAWRAGEISAEIAQNFTLADGHKHQVKVLDQLRKKQGGLEHVDVATVRKQFTGSEAEANRLLKFVTRDAYVAAGGALTEDLFTSSIVVHNMAKLKRLAQDKLDLEANRLTTGEGWSWAEPQLKTSHMGFNGSHVKAKPDFTPDEKKRLREIEARDKKLDAELCADETADPTGLYAEIEQLKAEQERIETAAEMRAFKPEQKAKAGCIIRIAEDGTLIIDAGIVKPKEDKDAGPGKVRQSQPEQPALSWDVKSALNHWSGASAGEALARNDRAALAAMLASVAVYRGPIAVNFGNRVRENITITKANNFRGAFEQLLALPLPKLVELTVQVISASVDLSNLVTTADRAAFVDVLDEKLHAAAAKRLFDAKVYFKGASKPHILSVILEVLGEDERRRNAEKSQHDLAKFAVDSIAALGWLPPELRTASYVPPKPKAAAEAEKRPDTFAHKKTKAKAIGSAAAKPKKAKVAAAKKKGAAKRKSK